jgi:hypothetical protein
LTLAWKPPDLAIKNKNKFLSWLFVKNYAVLVSTLYIHIVIITDYEQKFFVIFKILSSFILELQFF